MAAQLSAKAGTAKVNAIASQHTSACATPARLVTVQAQPSTRGCEVIQPEEPFNIRRSLLLSGACAVLLPFANPAQAVQSSSLCVDTATEEEDTACRRNQLALDAVENNRTENYSNSTTRKFEVAPNVPVANLNDEYTQATTKLIEQIETYCTIDVYNKQRIPLIKALKADSAAWVSKYARGGSARSQSARRMYIAVDAIAGHLASNGLAPLPAPKVKSVLKSIEEAKELLAKAI